MAINDVEDDVGSMWRDYKIRRQEKRRRNLEGSVGILKSRGVLMHSANDYVHVQIRHDGFFIDFWPSTGSWIARTPHATQGRGVFSLLKYLDQYNYPYDQDAPGVKPFQPYKAPQQQPQQEQIRQQPQAQVPVLLKAPNNVSDDPSSPPWDI